MTDSLWASQQPGLNHLAEAIFLLRPYLEKLKPHAVAHSIPYHGSFHLNRWFAGIRHKPDPQAVPLWRWQAALDPTAPDRDIDHGASGCFGQRPQKGGAEGHRVSHENPFVLSPGVVAWLPANSQKPVGAELAAKRTDRQES